LRNTIGNEILWEYAVNLANKYTGATKYVNINRAIIRYGEEAVFRYRTIANLDQDNAIPEIFLGGFIACGMHYALDVHAHVEHLYTKILKELGVEVGADLQKRFRGLLADVAVYHDGRPKAIVELKKFDDGKNTQNIIDDRDKMRELSRECGIEAYLGVLITDVESGTITTCTDRAYQLGDRLEHEFDIVGDKQRSRNGAWEWCFASGRIA